MNIEEAALELSNHLYSQYDWMAGIAVGGEKMDKILVLTKEVVKNKELSTILKEGWHGFQVESIVTGEMQPCNED